jgi:hypothetical protein
MLSNFKIIKKESCSFGAASYIIKPIFVSYLQHPETQQSCLSTQQVGGQSSTPQQVLFVPTKVVPIANKNVVPTIK